MKVYKGCTIDRCIEVTSLYTAFEAEFDSNYFFSGEAHDFWELVYAKKGSVGIVSNDRTYKLSKGQLILHPPMEYHRIWSEDNDEATVIIISFAAKWNNCPEKLIFNLDDAEINEIEEILAGINYSFIMEKRAVTLCKEGFEASAQLTVSKLEKLLLSIAVSNDIQAQDLEVYNKKYAQIVNVLEQNLAKNISVEEIAQQCNMSVSSVKTIFFKYSGMGIKHYFNEMKARQATQYLHDGYSVKETAAMLGFSDQNYFSAFFKRIIGMPPTEYVKQ